MEWIQEKYIQAGIVQLKIGQGKWLAWRHKAVQWQRGKDAIIMPCKSGQYEVKSTTSFCSQYIWENSLEQNIKNAPEWTLRKYIYLNNSKMAAKLLFQCM